MRIIVCVKHVPDIQSKHRFEDGRLVRGEDDVLNELDESAAEVAVQLVEEHGGEVITLIMGLEDAEDVLMRAPQMGADRGALIIDERLADMDVGLTALALAVTIQKIDEDGRIDLVVTGMVSFDLMTPMLPVAPATRLGMPPLGPAHSVEVDPGSGRVTIGRAVGGYDDELAAVMPLVASVTDQINEPRYPAFVVVKVTCKKPMDQVGPVELTFIPTGALIEGCSRVIEVFETDEVVCESIGAIILDSDDAGARLAAYLLEVVK